MCFGVLMKERVRERLPFFFFFFYLRSRFLFLFFLLGDPILRSRSLSLSFSSSLSLSLFFCVIGGNSFGVMYFEKRAGMLTDMGCDFVLFL